MYGYCVAESFMIQNPSNSPQTALVGGTLGLLRKWSESGHLGTFCVGENGIGENPEKGHPGISQLSPVEPRRIFYRSDAEHPAFCIGDAEQHAGEPVGDTRSR